MNCLRLVPLFSASPFSAPDRPIRVPRPAAGMMAATFIKRELGFGGWGLAPIPNSRLSVSYNLFGPAAGLGGAAASLGPVGGRRVLGPLVVFAEDHLPGRRLQNARDRDING